MRVGGLDLSLASTGVAVITVAPDAPGARWSAVVHRLQSPPSGPKLIDRHQRFLQSADRVMHALSLPIGGTGSTARGYFPDLVVVEGPSMGSIQGAHDISGHWHRVLERVLTAGIPVVEVAPTSLKLYVAGSGATRGPNKVEKRHMVQAVKDRYGIEVARQIDGNGSDVADAFGLAALGCRLLGRAIEPHGLPAANLRALDKLDLSPLAAVRDSDVAW